MTEQPMIIHVAADIVAAFVSHNTLRASELPDLIAAVHASLSNGSAPAAAEEPAPSAKAAVSIRKSITDGYLICLDDGKQFKSLRRHLAILGMTPEQYRAKWGLPSDYPMVAPGYARERSRLAFAIGLGTKRAPVPAPPPVAVETPPAKRRGRPARKAA